MAEICPARAVEHDPDSGMISEANLPAACLSCIERAREDSRSSVATVDTFEQGLARAREYVGDQELPADEFDRWASTMMYDPGKGPARRALIEYGFDLGRGYGQSYIDGSETEVTELDFDCYEEAAGL